jgi:DHA3 family macrolide efflux protein-like MFS transporter
MQASVPLLAPKSELLRIAGINQIIQSVSYIAGPAVGALAISLLTIGQVLLLDIAGAIIAITSLLLVKIPNPVNASLEKSSIKQVIHDISLGIKAVTENKGISFMFLFSVIATFCIMPIAVLFPLMTLQHFGGGKFEMSIIEIAWGVGMLAGSGLLGILKLTINKVIILNCMNLILGITLAYSGLLSSNGFIFFAILTVIGGIAASIFQASFTTIIQEKIDSAMLGRVFSMYFSVSLLPSMIGLLSTGFIADYIGIGLTFVILGSIIAIIGIISFFVPVLMRLGISESNSDTK